MINNNHHQTVGCTALPIKDSKDSKSKVRGSSPGLLSLTVGELDVPLARFRRVIHTHHLRRVGERGDLGVLPAHRAARGARSAVAARVRAVETLAKKFIALQAKFRQIYLK